MVQYYLNGELMEKITFPITQVGDQSLITLTVKNDNREHVELIPHTEDKEVSIIEYPRHLEAGKEGTTKWVFSPITERSRSLSCENGFKIIIG